METETKLKVKALPQCTRCQGSLVLDRELDLITGLALPVLLCINCGCRTPLMKNPSPLYRN
ncbi:MAG: hypothetical protein O2999_04005 [Nitrospirae bacterium]|nr:hypothetical protein [Nitrospirota bacterium]MDA1303451.1 hypothetical protein [Nitrospirota bacterium]